MIQDTQYSSASRVSGRFSLSASLIIVAMIAASAAAGSIFDDNWTPPKSAERPKQPVQAAPTTTAPAPTPDTPLPKPAPSLPNQPTGVTPPPVETPAPILPAAPAKLPIPAKANLTRSRKLLREAYADLLKDKSFKARRSLVQTLLEESDKSANNPSDQFALLAGAIDAAKEGESLRLCITAADKLSELFDVDGLKLKVQAATTMILKAPAPADTAENIRADLELADQLMAAEDFAGAARVIALARPLAADNLELRGQVLNRSQAIDQARSAYEQIQPYLDKLKTAPGDGPANLALGAHYCLKLGQWDKGLAYLAKGSDAKFKELAAAELAATSDTVAALTLAAGWWERAEEKGTSDADAKAIKLHAATWYRFGQSAAGGLAAKVVEVRLNQAALLGFSGGGPAVAAVMSHPVGHSGPPGTIDLLRLIDLKKDVVDGTWTMGADGLKVEASTGEPSSKIRFPYAPPAEYDVNIELTRLKNGRRQLNCIRCPQGDDPYIAVIGDNGNHDVYVSGANDPSGLRTRSDPAMADNQRSKIRLEIRREKFSIYVDGKLSAAYALTTGQGDRNYEWWAGDRLIAFSTWNALVIHSMKVTERGQGGMVMALGPAAGIPALPAPPPSDVPKRIVNLLPLIDPQRDAHEGLFDKMPGGAIFTHSERCRIRIPYQAPDEYDFRVVFRRVEGYGWLGQICPVESKGVMWLMALNANTISGFEHIKGQPYHNNPTTIHASESLRNGQQYTCVVHVRRRRICVSLDGRLIADYKTDGSDLSISEHWTVGDHILGVASDGARIQYDAIEVREISGRGKTVAHAEFPTLAKAPPDDSAQKTVDLMPLIDPSVDTVGGRWYRVNKTTLASDGSAARLRIPYHPPQEYDFHVRLRRTAGGQFAALLLSHGLHNFHWIMGGWDNRYSGLELVDGRRADGNPTLVKSDSVFQNARPMDVVAYVRNGSVSISCDGKLVLDYKTDYHELTPLTEAYIGDGVLGLYANSAAFQVDLIEIREITGEGKPSPRGQ